MVFRDGCRTRAVRRRQGLPVPRLCTVHSLSGTYESAVLPSSRGRIGRRRSCLGHECPSEIQDLKAWSLRCWELVERLGEGTAGTSGCGDVSLKRYWDPGLFGSVAVSWMS